MLMKFVNQNSNNWDHYIGILLAAYRSTPHPSTGYTPNMMMFGREVNMPADVVYPMPSKEASTDVHEYVHELRKKMESCFQLTRQHLQAAATRQKRDYDSRIFENKYTIGDLVYKRRVNAKKTTEAMGRAFRHNKTSFKLCLSGARKVQDYDSASR